MHKKKRKKAFGVIQGLGFRDEGFPDSGVDFGASHKKDYSSLGPTLGSAYLAKLPSSRSQVSVRSQGSGGEPECRKKIANPFQGPPKYPQMRSVVFVGYLRSIEGSCGLGSIDGTCGLGGQQ